MTITSQNSNLPQALIVACSQDSSHAHDRLIGVVAQSGDEPIQGTDYLQILSPGAFPQSLRDAADLSVRFDNPPITVATHSGCGVIGTLRLVAQNPDLNVKNPPVLFGESAKEIVQLFSTYGITPDDLCAMDDVGIAHALAKLIAAQLAEHFEMRASEVADSQFSDDATQRIRNLPFSRIAVAYTPEPDSDLVELVPFTQARDIVANGIGI